MRPALATTRAFATAATLSSSRVHTIQSTKCPAPPVNAHPQASSLIQVPSRVQCAQPLRPQHTMADDQSYGDFLTKANQDPSTTTHTSRPQATSQAKSKFDPSTPQTSAVPVALQHLDATYTSDADLPFEPVLLDYSGHELPDARQFATCAKQAAGAVEALEEGDFDPRGQYKDVIAKVKEAGNGEVACFRVEVSSTRAEYYVVSVGERKLLGVRAKAVES